MRVLVVGNGGREHALVWAAARAGAEVWATRPNPGMAALARSVAASPDDVPAVVASARAIGAELVLVGPEAPLVAGLADALRAAGIATFGPGSAGARLEASKAHTKAFLQRHGIPTARHRTCATLTESLDFLRHVGAPLVVKADGLAAGKGVVVAESVAEAEAAIAAFQGPTQTVGAAGAVLVLEERLVGPEVSALAICDGERLVGLDLCRDHKRLHDGDRGPNTGGMGACCPLTDVPPDVARRIRDDVLVPTLRGLRRDGIDFRGVIYAGLMLTADGPMVLEYNVRLGDPEAQVLLPRLGRSFLALAHAAATADLPRNKRDLEHLAAAEDARPAVTVVLAAAGYPHAPRKGDTIHGLAEAQRTPDVLVFQAGTAAHGDDVVTAGGRVLAVTGLGPTLAAARATAYAGAECIRFAGMQRRGDVAAAALASP
jgi:phosphoribosylamine--glycine ligase